MTEAAPDEDNDSLPAKIIAQAKLGTGTHTMDIIMEHGDLIVNQI
jgi:hypothetical protein